MTHEERLAQTLALYHELGTERAVAERLGLAPSTVHERLVRAAEKGLIPRQDWAPQMPAGFMLKGVSTYTDEDGKVRGQWFKATRERERFNQAFEVIQEALQEAPTCPEVRPPEKVSSTELLSVYPNADLHLGMYAWAKEVGIDYDADIAWQLLESATHTLVSQMPIGTVAVDLELGDFFHADNDLGRTFKHGNILDTDTRFARVLKMGVDLAILRVELLLRHHTQVIVRFLPGNHDPYSSLALALAVAKFFENNPRVIVDLDPGYFWRMQWGLVMLAASHGDMTRPEEMTGVMAARWPEIWGATRYRYAHLGHVHHKSKGAGEGNGVIWETHQTLAPKDSWHHQKGYSPGRSMCAIVYHKDTGERFRVTHSVGWR